MRLMSLSFVCFASLLAACGGPKEDTGDDPVDTDTDTDSGGDTDTDTDTDSGDTDTDTDTDSGDTDSGDTDTDTGPDEPLPNTGYYGPTLVVAIVADGPTPDAAARLVAIDPLDPATVLELESGLRADAHVDCADSFVFALETRSATSESDRAIGFDVAGGNRVEWDLGSNFRPSDVAVGGTGPWVASEGKARIEALRPDGTSDPIVNLADQADADGIPEVMGLYTGDGVVYAVLARVTQGTNAPNGPRLLELSAGTGAVLRVAELPSAGSRIPSGQMNLRADTVDVHYGATVGSGGSVSDDAGLERVALGGFTSTGTLLDDSGSGRAQVAAWFDSRGETAWLAWTESGAPNVGAFKLVDGAPQQRWPSPESVVGLGLLTGTVWVGANPFDGTDGVIVARNAADGAERSRTTLGGRVADFALCERGAPPARDDTGAPPER
jgi:hypothetical protein